MVEVGVSNAHTLREKTPDDLPSPDGEDAKSNSPLGKGPLPTIRVAESRTARPVLLGRLRIHLAEDFLPSTHF